MYMYTPVVSASYLWCHSHSNGEYRTDIVLIQVVGQFQNFNLPSFAVWALYAGNSTVIAV